MIRYIYICIILTLSLCFISAKLQASTVDTLNVKKLHIDTTKTLIINDTLYVKSKMLQKENSFFNRNEGTILGSALAAFVSLLAILITSLIRNRRDKREKEFLIGVKQNIYCGLLHSIYHELGSHQNLVNVNWKSLELIRDVTLEKEKFIIEKTVETFNTDFINECRLKILEFESYNTDLLPVISKYKNSVISVNRSLDFKNLNSFFEQLEIPFSEAVNLYFKIFKEDFNRIELGIQEIQKMIKEEIRKFTQNEVID